MKTCYFYKGRVIKARVRHVHRWQERIVVFEDVPADVCQQCGESYFDPNVLEAIDRITLGDTEPKATMSVPVFSLADVA